MHTIVILYSTPHYRYSIPTVSYTIVQWVVSYTLKYNEYLPIVYHTLQYSKYTYGIIHHAHYRDKTRTVSIRDVLWY